VTRSHELQLTPLSIWSTSHFSYKSLWFCTWSTDCVCTTIVVSKSGKIPGHHIEANRHPTLWSNTCHWKWKTRSSSEFIIHQLHCLFVRITDVYSAMCCSIGQSANWTLGKNSLFLGGENFKLILKLCVCVCVCS